MEVGLVSDGCSFFGFDLGERDYSGHTIGKVIAPVLLI